MSDITILSSPNDIDLGRHGVIEAHAGTGKTHTVVEMVLRILEQTIVDEKGTKRYIPSRDILLVTYTEKAAGDLTKRIREGIERRIAELSNRGAEAADVRGHLEDCLNNLHESFIGTIHGICLRLLQTWPFETGVHFETTMADDAEGLADTLRESMRTHWQDETTHIPWALGSLQDQGRQFGENRFALVTEIAGKLLDKEHAVLDRRAIGGQCLGDLRAGIENAEQYLDDNDHALSFRSIVESLIDALNRVSAAGGLEADRLASLHFRVPQLQEMCRANRYDAKILKAPCKVGRGCIYTKAHLKTNPEFAVIDRLCAAITSHPYLEQLKKKEGLSALLPLTLACDAAEILRDTWVEAKLEKGLISFQDMLRLMHAAVFGNPLFCVSLRKRLRFAIIDEFQDTSILQWEIFERIFLELPGEDGPRLFIVGDPKQSIYAFQGADVQSYLDAKSAIVKNHGRVYGLIHNYRSLPQTIAGYNAIFDNSEDGDWFAFDTTPGGAGRISYPSEGEGGAIARVPEERESMPRHALADKPVHVMVLQGSALQRRSAMAADASMVIRSLKGKTISVPRGLKWEDITLDYRDFAVIVETHRLADQFLDRFQADGIPVVKYKMEGVFQSPIAGDLHALLNAVLHPSGDPAPRLACLLTRFFNRHPAAIDPDKDLEPCLEAGAECRRGATCMFHALEEWTFLAARRLWSQLFKSILTRTGIRERCIRLVDGQRHLADLSQVSDYCLERLYRGNDSLQQLVEHLGRLLAEEETAGRDQNLFTLATDKSSVRVLTMHAAKGLEFPVVFVATGASADNRKGMGTMCWIEDKRQRVMPTESFGKDLLNELFNGNPHTSPPFLQQSRERRRRLYVALTRAQAMLFVPAHVASVTMAGGLSWQEGCPLPEKYPDIDLTPRLLRLLDRKEPDHNKIELFDRSAWDIRPSQKPVEPDDHLDPHWKIPSAAHRASDQIDKKIQALVLPGRICRQTSYSEISRRVASDRFADHSEEENDTDTVVAANAQRPLLPGGASTGDALHLAIEEILGRAGTANLTTVNTSVDTIVKKYLEKNKVLHHCGSPAAQGRAIDAAVAYINGALTAPLTLAMDGTVRIGDLALSDRIAEMEFFLSVGPHWVHGFMDLVFRLENRNAQHPWRYYVLDWKSDQLEQFDEEHLQSCVQERHYDLQSKLYCHALDKHLKGLLGSDYDPGQNLGGSIVVFLRSFQATQPAGACHAWTRTARPEEDMMFTKEQLENILRS